MSIELGLICSSAFRTSVSPGACVQEQYVVLEDPALQHTSTGYNVVVQQLELVLLTRAAVMQSHKASTNVWMLDYLLIQNHGASTNVWVLKYLLITVTVSGLQKHCVTCIAYQCGFQHLPGSRFGGHFAEDFTFFNTTLSGCRCACSHAKSSLFWLLIRRLLYSVDTWSIWCHQCILHERWQYLRCNRYALMKLSILIPQARWRFMKVGVRSKYSTTVSHNAWLIAQLLQEQHQLYCHETTLCVISWALYANSKCINEKCTW